jgi:hypothetical protein
MLLLQDRCILEHVAKRYCWGRRNVDGWTAIATVATIAAIAAITTIRT